MLQTQGDLFLLAVDVQHHDLDLLVDGHHFRRMADAAPAHIGNVQQAVDAAQVDERAELGDVLDHALAQLTFFQFAQQFLAVFLALLLDERASAHDDIAARLVDLEHFALHEAADVIANIVRAADIDLAGRQEHIHADIDQQTALDFADHLAGNDLAFLDGFDDPFPFEDFLGLLLAEAEHAEHVIGPAHFIFDIFNEHLEGVAHLGLFFLFFPFVQGNGAFAFETDVDDDEVVFHADDATFEDFVDVDIGIDHRGRGEGVVEPFERRRNFGGQFVIDFKRTD